MRYLASITYDGSKFYGFQKLKNHKTVQGELEKTLTKINKTIVMVKGAGRTDRGVHAFSQIVHFDLNITIDEDSLKRAINSGLHEGLYVNYCEIVQSDFHARFDALNKTYEYVINLGEYSPLAQDYIYNYNHQLALKEMKKAAKYLVGPHSFKAFVSGVRDNYDSIMTKVQLKRQKDVLVIRFAGKTFYNHMVRNMVGALLLVGQGKIKPIMVYEMLMKETNIYNYMTVPAAGLYLISVDY